MTVPPDLQVAFSQHVDQMENFPWFYDWLTNRLQRARIPLTAEIVDIGCGTGALLERLALDGYAGLTGTDFAEGCIAATTARVPNARVWLHDIESGALRESFDVAFMTGVADFLSDSERALANVRQSLRPGGHLFVTVRNREAYYPAYYLRGFARYLEWSPRLKHWFTWFTTPLALRREWPSERLYVPAEMREQLERAGFSIVRESSAQLAPSLWIPDLQTLFGLLQRIDRLCWDLPATPLGYQRLFQCRRLER